jgi:hypothetical protein
MIKWKRIKNRYEDKWVGRLNKFIVAEVYKISDKNEIYSYYFYPKTKNSSSGREINIELIMTLAEEHLIKFLKELAVKKELAILSSSQKRDFEEIQEEWGEHCDCAIKENTFCDEKLT